MARKRKLLFGTFALTALLATGLMGTLIGRSIGAADTEAAVAQAQAQAATFAYQGREIPLSDQEIVNPKHTALIVHEMLNDFVSPGGVFDKRGRRIDATAIVPPIQKLIAAARAKNVRVVYVRWTSLADNSSSSDPNIRNSWSRLSSPDERRFMPSTVEGTWGWEIIDDLKPLPGDWVFRKYRPDAFFGTNLDEFLRWNGIKTVAIVGIGAEVGVVPTVMTASNKGYFTVAVSDALRPTDPKRADDAMLYLRSSSMTKTHTELIDMWDKSPRFDVGPAPTGAAPAAGAEPATITYGGRTIPNTEQAILDPKHTILVVHEMCNDFISKGGVRDQEGHRIEASHILQPIAKLLAAARAKKVQVAYVRWTRFLDRSTDSDPVRRSVYGKPPILIATPEGSWGWQAPDEIKPEPGDWVLRKWRTDAFFATPLDTLMRWNGMKTMVIVGIGAEAGIVPTVMHASNLGYFNVAVEDAIAPSNPTRMADAMRFISGQSIVKKHTDIIGIWAKSAARP